jgi:hypothetical protein
MQAMQVTELCRSCRHERASHREEDGRCMESVEMLEGEDGIAVAIPCQCPGWARSNAIGKKSARTEDR